MPGTVRRTPCHCVRGAGMALDLMIFEEVAVSVGDGFRKNRISRWKRLR